MPEQERKTLVCPSCGNINPYTADVCLKCGLSLGPIREALAKAGTPAPPKPKEPVPEIPKLPIKERKEDMDPLEADMGQLVDGRLLLIRRMAEKRDDVVAFFFKQLASREIPDVDLSEGHLVIDRRERDYIFIERYLGEPIKLNVLLQKAQKDRLKGTDWHRAKATMAVRIFPSGKDLMVEWRHYVRTSWGWLGRTGRLEGFQQQDSDALQLAIRASLEEAIDLVGISKELVQEVSKEQRRVI